MGDSTLKKGQNETEMHTLVPSPRLEVLPYCTSPRRCDDRQTEVSQSSIKCNKNESNLDWGQMGLPGLKSKKEDTKDRLLPTLQFCQMLLFTVIFQKKFVFYLWLMTCSSPVYAKGLFFLVSIFIPYSTLPVALCLFVKPFPETVIGLFINLKNFENSASNTKISEINYTYDNSIVITFVFRSLGI